MAKTPETFTIIKTRRGNKTETTGTLAELTKYFGYTLECGKSYNPRIPLAPRTAKSLVSALNLSMDETQKGSYNPTYFDLAE